jgi:hypothetical protein
MALRPQCATCLNELVVIQILESMWKDQQAFNSAYLLYQDSVIKNGCSDYIAAFHFKELDSF